MEDAAVLSTTSPVSGRVYVDQLLELVRSGTGEEQNAAIRRLNDLAIYAAYRELITDAGGIDVLVQLLRVGTPAQKSQAAVTIHRLALANTSVKTCVRESGGVHELVSLVRDGTEEQKVQATGALSCLVFDGATQHAIVTAGGLPPLLNLCQSRSNPASKHALRVLRELVNTAEYRRQVRQLGGIRTLVRSLRGCQLQVELALGIFFLLAGDGATVISDLVNAGVVFPLLLFIGADRPKVRERATNLLVGIVLESPQNKHSFVVQEMGVPLMVNLLRNGSKVQQEQAIDMLADLAGYRSFSLQMKNAGVREALLETQQRSNAAGEHQLTVARRILDSNDETHPNHPLYPADPYSETVGGLDTTSASTPAPITSNHQLRSLCEHLRSGTVEEKHQALARLQTATRCRQFRWMVRGAYWIRPLVQFVQHGTNDAKEQATASLANLALDIPEIRSTVCRCGGLSPLVELLHAGTDQQKTVAALALWNLTCENSVNKIVVVELGGLPHLTALVREGTELQQIHATGVVANLVSLPALATTTIESGFLSLFLDSVVNGTNDLSRTALQVILNLVRHHGCLAAVAKASGVDAVLRRLKQVFNDGIDEDKPLAVETLVQLAMCESEFNAAVERCCDLQLIECLLHDRMATKDHWMLLIVRLVSVAALRQSAVRLLVQKLEGSSPERNTYICRVFHELVRDKSMCRPIREEGTIVALTRLLGKRDPETQRAATMVIQDFAFNDAENQEACGEAGTIPALLRLAQIGPKDHAPDALEAVHTILFKHRGNQQRLVECNGIVSTLLHLGDTFTARERLKATKILATIVTHPHVRSALLQTNVLHMLVRCLRREGQTEVQLGILRVLIGNPSEEEVSPVVRFVQVKTLTRGWCFDLTNKALCVFENHIVWHAEKLKNGSDHQKDIAAKVLKNLVNRHARMVIDAGGVGAFLELARNGTKQQRKTAWSALVKLIAVDAAQAAVLDAGGAVVLLLIWTGNGSTKDKAHCLQLLIGLARTPRGATAIASCGGVEFAIDRVHRGAYSEIPHAIKLLRRLSHKCPDFHDRISGTRAINVLVELTRFGSEEQKLVAADALCSAARGHGPAIVQAGGVDPLWRLLKSGTEKQKECAARALLDLTESSSADGNAIPSERLRMLVEMLQSSSADSLKLLALRALCNGSRDNTSRRVIGEAGTIAPTIELLNQGTAAQKHAAASLLACLTCQCPANQARVADAGGAAWLVRLMRLGADELKSIAAGVLRDVASTRHEAVVDADGIAVMLELAQEGTDRQKQIALETLRIVSAVVKHRPAIVSAGGVKVLYPISRRATSRELQQLAKCTLYNLACTEQIGFAIGGFAFIWRSER